MAISIQEANRLISQKIAQAEALVRECEELADQTGAYFHIEFGGYGSGATYTGRGPKEDWSESSEEWQESSSEYGWLASSQSC